MSKKSILKYFLILQFLLCFPFNVRSADFFPSDSNELQANLNTAASNGQDDTITLEAKTYRTLDNGFGGAFTFNSAENNNLVVQGAGIGQTILDGEGVANDRVIGLESSGNGTLVVQNLTIQHGSFASGDGSGISLVTDTGAAAILECEITENEGNEVIGIHLRSFNGNAVLANSLVTNNIGNSTTGNGVQAGNFGDILIQENTFSGNEASNQAGISAQSSDGDITFNRNLVIDNHSVLQDTGGVRLTTAGGDMIFTNNIVVGNSAVSNNGGVFLIPNTGSIFFVNNTITENVAGNEAGGININVNDIGDANIFNNIIFGNQGTANKGMDIFIDDIFTVSPAVRLFNNNFTEFCFDSGSCDPTTLGANQANNIIGIDPEFSDPDNQDYHLLVSSPVIEKGNNTPPGGLPSPDFEGVTRPLGASPNMGALETVVSESGGGCSLMKRNIPKNSLWFGLCFILTIVFFIKIRSRFNC